MSSKFTNRADFSIPSSLIDEHEWMSDSLIDDLGKICIIVYPFKDIECPNCYLDRRRNRSSNIYKSGGPIVFTNHTECPWCHGRGRGQIESTDEIRTRLYWEPKSWIGGISFEDSNDIVQMIGYMTDVIKIQKAHHILLANINSSIHQWKGQREGDFTPHGFRQDRYFVQFFRKMGGD